MVAGGDVDDGAYKYGVPAAVATAPRLNGYTKREIIIIIFSPKCFMDPVWLFIQQAAKELVSIDYYVYISANIIISILKDHQWDG